MARRHVTVTILFYCFVSFIRFERKMKSEERKSLAIAFDFAVLFVVLYGCVSVLAPNAAAAAAATKQIFFCFSVRCSIVLFLFLIFFYILWVVIELYTILYTKSMRLSNWLYWRNVSVREVEHNAICMQIYSWQISLSSFGDLPSICILIWRCVCVCMSVGVAVVLTIGSLNRMEEASKLN